jgi:predicted nucleic acid-binding Zn ribbon protein
MPQISVFQCPSCHEYIAADAKSCRFCSTPIDAQRAQAASVAQETENRLYRRKQYARHMLTGSGLFALGLLIAVVSYVTTVVFSGGGFYLVTYGLMLSGLGDFLYGFVGWLGELRKR